MNNIGVCDVPYSMKWTCYEVVPLKFTLGLCYVPFHTNLFGVGQYSGTRKLPARHPFANRSRPSRIGTRNSDHVFVRICVYK